MYAFYKLAKGSNHKIQMPDEVLEFCTVSYYSRINRKYYVLPTLNVYLLE